MTVLEDRCCAVVGCAEPAALCAAMCVAARVWAARGGGLAERAALCAALSIAVRACFAVVMAFGETLACSTVGSAFGLGEAMCSAPRAALCAALSAAVRGCVAAGTASGEALALLCAARWAAERGPAISAAFETPQVSAAVDTPQQDPPRSATIRVIAARGVAIGLGSIAAMIAIAIGKLHEEFKPRRK